MVYLDINYQNLSKFSIVKLLPYNHYVRKMIGYLFAISNGATSIIDTDDDNIPKEDWCFPSSKALFNVSEPDQGFVNIYKYYTNIKIWPRGLPLVFIDKAVN